MSVLIDPTLEEMLQEMEDRLVSGTGELSAATVREILTPIITRAWNGGGGSGEAEGVHVLIEGITETFGSVNPGQAFGDSTTVGTFDGSLALLLNTMFITFKAPAIDYLTLRGSSSVIVPIGKPYPANAGGSSGTQFQWSTRNSNRVTAAGLTLRDVTGNTNLGTALPAIGSLQPATPGFVATEGVCRTYRIQGNSTAAGNPLFYMDLTITGTVYRAAFVSGEDLLNPAVYSDALVSSYILGQTNTELVYSKTIPVRTYQPRNQKVFFMLDRRLITVGGLGSTFLVSGQPNNDFAYRDFDFVNEFGATNQVRLYATGNRLNADFPIGVNV